MLAENLRDRSWWWAAVAAAAFAGLLLRVAAAQGALWTDEAWSVIYAAEAGDPAGVFLRINHDNNHHLYSLWLQAVGTDSPSWLARLPAIVAGTVSILVAAMLVGRRSAWAGIAAALLLALSPTFVTFGSEARGYALMLLAALVLTLIATEALERGAKAATPWWLALVAALGMLSHMTMAAPVGLVALWVYLDRRAAHGPAQALRTTVRLMGPAIAATAGIVALVFAAAWASPTGMRLGGYLPFRWSDYAVALDDLTRATVGLSALRPWAGPLVIGLVALAVAIRPPQWLGSRGRLYALLILGVPVAAALLQPGNAGFSRYYLCSALGLLLLASEWLGRGLAQAGFARALAASALGAIAFIGIGQDWELVESQRGRPDGAVQLLARHSPGSASVALDPWRLQGMMTLAAARSGYALAIADGCAPAEFLVTAQTRFASAPLEIERCGTHMRAIGSAAGTPLTGDRWTLYRAERLQTAGPAVSGPAPGARNRRLSGRAGVAQG